MQVCDHILEEPKSLRIEAGNIEWMHPLGVKILDLSVNEGVEEDIEMAGVHANVVMRKGHI